jgi:hypothetical protein
MLMQRQNSTEDLFFEAGFIAVPPSGRVGESSFRERSLDVNKEGMQNRNILLLGLKV